MSFDEPGSKQVLVTIRCEIGKTQIDPMAFDNT